MCLLFYFLRELPGRKDIVWDRSRLVDHQIFDYMHNIGDYKAQDNALATFFVVFQNYMHDRERIPRI